MRVVGADFREYARSHLWVLPSFLVALAFALSRLTLKLDESIGRDASAWYLFPGGGQSARSLLSTIASSVLTLTGVVFSITILVLQLASSQLSPRVMRTFLRDFITQLTLAMFVAVFVFSLLILRQTQEPDVPSLSIWMCLLLALAAIIIFIAYIDHMVQAIRPVAVVSSLREETLSTIDRLYEELKDVEPQEESLLSLSDDYRILSSNKGPGVVTSIDEERLLKALGDSAAILAIIPRVGDFVPDGRPLVLMWGDADGINESLILAAIGIQRDRTMHQDPRFGLRQLVDIAERALSPGTNDPTTSVQAADQIHQILRVLSRREIPSPRLVNRDGRLRLIVAQPSWDEYVALSFNEIRRYGDGSFQVIAKLEAMIDDLLSCAPESRKQPLLVQRNLLLEAIQRTLPATERTSLEQLKSNHLSQLLEDRKEARTFSRPARSRSTSDPT